MVSYDAYFLASTWYTGKAEKPKSNKLQDQARHVHIPEKDAHRALGDAETVEKLLKNFCAPLNPAFIIEESIRNGIHFMSPGVGVKQIILEAKERIKSGIDEKEAVRLSVFSYLQNSQKEEGEEDRPRIKRQKTNATETQGSDILSQSFSQPQEVF